MFGAFSSAKARVGWVAWILLGCAGSPRGPEEPPPRDPAPSAETNEAPEASPAPESAPASEELPATEEFPTRPKRAPESGAFLPSNALGFVDGPLLGQPLGGELRLHFIDVGQGDSTLIECPGGGRILLDGGSGSGRSAKPAGAKAYLDATLGERRVIDLVLVSHPDVDHYNALPFLLEGVELGQIELVGPLSGYGATFLAWFQALPAERRRPLVETPRHDPPDAPNVHVRCGSADVFVLAVAVPSRKKQANFVKNTTSLVLLLSYGEFDALLTADATFETEEQILQWYPEWWLDVELLKVGHHGSSATSTSARWLRATRPDVAVVSSAHTNVHGHPRAEVIQRVAAHTTSSRAHRFRWYTTQKSYVDLPEYEEAIYGTGPNGTIVVGSSGRGYWVSREK